MKKILFLLLFIPFISKSQYDTVKSYGYVWKRGIFDTSIRVPRTDTLHKDPSDSGTVIFDTILKQFMGANGHSWSPMSFPYGWQSVLNQNDSLNRSNYVEVEGNDFSFNHTGIFSVDALTFSLPKLSGGGSVNYFLTTDAFGNLYLKEPDNQNNGTGDGGALTLQDVMKNGTTITQLNRVRGFGYDFYWDSSGSISLIGGNSSFSDPHGAYSQIYANDESAYLFSQTDSTKAFSEIFVQPGSAELESADADSLHDSHLWSIGRQGKVDLFGDSLINIDAPDIYLPQHTNSDTTKFLTTNSSGKLIFKTGSGGGGGDTTNISHRLDTLSTNKMDTAYAIDDSTVRYCKNGNCWTIVTHGGSIISDIQWSVLDILNTPPGSPTTGDIYLVGTSGTGAFSGHNNQIATWNGSIWTFQTANSGDLLQDDANSLVYKYSGSAWTQVGKAPLLNNGNKGIADLKGGAASNNQFSIITNNTKRMNFAAGGTITFNGLTGAAAGILGLSISGIASNVQPGYGQIISSSIIKPDSTLFSTRAHADSIGNVKQNNLNVYDPWIKSGDTIYQRLNIYSYGAKPGFRDSGAINVSHDTLTITNPQFSVLHIGYPIVIYGAGAAGKNYYGTISSYISPYIVRVSSNASVTVSNKTVIWGQDNTTPFQNAFNDAVNIYRGAEIDVPRGIWMIAGALQHSYSLGYTTIDPNSQLVFPYASANSYASTKKCRVVLRGEIPPNFTQGTNTADSLKFFGFGGTVIYSTLTTYVSSGGMRPSIIATDGDSVTSQYNFSYVYFSPINLSFVTAGNPGGNGAVVGGINWKHGGALDGHYCLYFTDIPSAKTVNPVYDICGFEYPDYNGETNNSIDHMGAFRIRTGISYAEHSPGGSFFGATNYFDIEWKNNGHSSRLDLLTSQRSKNFIHAVGGRSWNTISMIDAEVDTATSYLSWAQWGYGLYDTANLAHGTIYDYQINNIRLGNITTPGVAQYDFTKNGGDSVLIHPIEEPWPVTARIENKFSNQNTFSGGVKVNIGSDAAWDIYYRDSATGNLQRLPKGADSTFLRVIGGHVVWSASSVSGGGTAAGGSNTQLQYNASGVLGGITGATSDGTKVFIPNLYGSSASGGSLFLYGTSHATPGFIKMGSDSGWTYDVSNVLETHTKDAVTNWNSFQLKNIRTSTSTVFDTTDFEMDAQSWKTTATAGSEPLKGHIMLIGASGTTHPTVKWSFAVDNSNGGGVGEMFNVSVANGGNPGTLSTLTCQNFTAAGTGQFATTKASFLNPISTTIGFGGAVSMGTFTGNSLATSTTLMGFEFGRGGTAPAVTLFQTYSNASAGWGTVSITNNATTFTSANLATEFLHTGSIMVINGNSYTVTGINLGTGVVTFTPAFSSATASYSITSRDGGGIQNIQVTHDNGYTGFATASPLSTVDIKGSFGTNYTSTSVSYTILFDDCVVEETGTGKNITLPDAAQCTRREIEIVATHASGADTVITVLSQTIAGASNYILATQNKYVRVKSNGTNWLVIANNGMNEWVMILILIPTAIIKRKKLCKNIS